MRCRRPALVALLAAGCWPYRTGPYDDYTTPRSARILGHAWYADYLGGYWEEDYDGGEIWWGWLEDGDAQIRALDLIAPDGVGCSTDTSEFGDFEGLFDDPGANSSKLDGPDGTISLPWIPGNSVFASTVDDLPIGQYDLEPLSTDQAGAIKVQTFLRVPKPADIDGISTLDDDEWGVVSLDELDFTWNPADELAQYVIVTVTLVDSRGDWLETGVCAAKYANGDVNFSTGLWAHADQARGAYITHSTANEQWVEIGDRGMASRTLCERREVGYVEID